jgi:hypothetical protein
MRLNEYSYIQNIEFKINYDAFNFTNKYYVPADFTYNNTLYQLYFYEIEGRLFLIINHNWIGFLKSNIVLHAKDFDFIFYKETIDSNNLDIGIKEVLSIYKLGILTNA